MTIPAGVYRGCAIRNSDGALAQYGRTANGNEQMVIDLRLIHRDADEQPLSEADGASVSTFLYFSDAAAPYSIERLRALGWTGDDITDLTGIESNEVDVEVKYEMYNGESKMKVQILTGGGRVKLKDAMAESEKRAFAARMRAIAGASKPKAPTGAVNGGNRPTF